MTIDELVEAMRPIAWKLVPANEGRRATLRIRSAEGELRPVAKLYEVRTGNVAIMSEWRRHARELGLSEAAAERVSVSADDRMEHPRYCADARAKMIDAMGFSARVIESMR